MVISAMPYEQVDTCPFSFFLEQLQKRINDALRTFDQRGDNTVDVSEIGSVFRSLRVNVAQADIKEITSQVLQLTSSLQKTCFRF